MSSPEQTAAAQQAAAVQQTATAAQQAATVQQTIGRKAVKRVALAGYEVSREFATLLTSAFGIVAALAWSDAVKGAFDRFAAFKNWPVIGPFVFAVVVTVAAYVIGMLTSSLVKEQCTKLCK